MLFFIMGENTVASIKLQVNCCQNTNTATRLHLNDLLEMLLCFGAAAPLVSLPCFFFLCVIWLPCIYVIYYSGSSAG